MENLPRSGSMRNGELYERPMLAPRIDGTGRSSWHTPRANECEEGAETFVKRNGDRGEHCFSGLSNQIANWPTPRSEDSESCGNHPGAVDSLTGATRQWTTPTATERSGQGERNKSLRLDAAQWKTPHGMNGIDHTGKAGAGGEFAKQATQWATPSAHDGRRPGSDATSTQGANLKRDAEQWATPQTHDSNGGSPERVGRFGTEHGGRNLADDVTAWGAESARPTPTTRDHKDGDVTESEVPTNGLRGRAASRYSHPPPATSTHGGASSPSGQTSRRRLNPAFVEWLMGWPVPGWTDFAPLEMAWFHSRQLSRLRFLLGEWD